MKRFLKLTIIWLLGIILTLGAGGWIAYQLNMTKFPTYPSSDHYDPVTQRFFNDPTVKQEIITADYIPGIRENLVDMTIHSKKFFPKSPFPMQKPDWGYFLAPSSEAKFIWLGHSSLLARISGKTFLIDGVFAKYASPVPVLAKRFQEPPIRRKELPNIDYMILSHNHYDHLDKNTIKHLRKTSTKFIVPLGIEQYLINWGIAPERISILDWWNEVKLEDLTITSTPARHNTGRGLDDGNKSLWSSYVFKTPTEQIFYSGDTSWGDGSHFQAIFERFGKFDWVFMENGQYNLAWQSSHMFPRQTVQATKILQATYFTPIHWGGYLLSPMPWDESVNTSISLAEKAGLKVVTPIQGQVVTKSTPTSIWWEMRPGVKYGNEDY